jgi:putative transposase
MLWPQSGAGSAIEYPAGARRRAAEPQRLFRLYREERLGVRKRGGRKRALGTRAPMALPQARVEQFEPDFAGEAGISP